MEQNTDQIITSEIAEFTERFINQTNRSIFLTGKAGTGKTTLLRKIVRSTHKQAVIVAPTGIAALNAGGVTIHSFFQLPFATFIPDFNITGGFNNQLKLESKQTLMHHFKMNSNVGRYLKKYHLQHHFRHEKSKYGVSNPLWDYIFFTVNGPKED